MTEQKIIDGLQDAIAGRTTETVIDWAEQIAWLVSDQADRGTDPVPLIAQALRYVVSAEREQCAQIAERHQYDKQSRTTLCYPHVATAIRGQT